MEDVNNDMERLYAETFQSIEEGTVLKGKIIEVRQNGVIVDIGHKSEGFIPIDEFSAAERRELEPGQTVEAYVVSMRDSEGAVRLSKDRAQKLRIWDVLEEQVKTEALVPGVITEKTKGGMNVDLGGVKAFLPGSQIDIRGVRDLDSLIGQTMDFRVLKVNNRRSNIIVSRRAVIEKERAALKGETIHRIKEGACLSGVVKNITDYGVFVDLGGIDGLLHISDISWGRIAHPSEFFSLGDTIEVIVEKYDEANERITLGYKQKTEDPWTTAPSRYQVGQKVTGRVSSTTDYGAFIKLEEGLEGLVHISEIDWSPKMKHPAKVLAAGDTVEAVVLKIDQNERKLSLSIKQAKPSPWELIAKTYAVGQRLSGKVKGLTDFGAFIGLPEGVDGLLHISDLSWTRHIKHPSEVLKKGQKIEVIILSLDPAHEKMSLGLKQLEEDPWLSRIPSEFRVGDQVQGRVLRMTDFGIFVELEGGIEGLVYSSESAHQNSEAGLKEGDPVEAKIIKVDAAERKIGLSMKNLNRKAEQ